MIIIYNRYQNWQYNAEKAILSGTTHLLAFNEPDIDSQANITVTAAMADYLDHIQGISGKAKLGSLAVKMEVGIRVWDGSTPSSLHARLTRSIS